MNDRIGELLNQLIEVVKETWGNSARIHVSCHPDGYQSITVEEWQADSNLPGEAWKRRELYDSWRMNDEWRSDRSAEQNEYYRKRKLLLEERAV